MESKELYRREPSKRAIDAYKELLQNVIRLFDSLSDHTQARQFADTIYNYEKRLVNDALYYSDGDHVHGGTVKLGQIKMELSTVAVYETIKAVFPKLKLSDSTEIWVEDYEMLKAVSKVVSTTDLVVLNDLTIWSVLRKLIPYSSADVRRIWSEYENAKYNIEGKLPAWYTCTDKVNHLLPLAIEYLTQKKNPNLSFDQKQTAYFESLFKSIRDTLVDDIRALTKNHHEYQALADKLAKVEVTIGIPQSLLDTDMFVENYYTEYLPQTINFVENVESHWAFEKNLLAKELGEFEEPDEILFHLFPAMSSPRADASFSVELNKLILKRRLTRKTYFDDKYPM